MNFWWFLLSVGWVALVALVFAAVFAAVTYSKRKGLRSASEEEFAEIRVQEGFNSLPFLGGHRVRSGVEASDKEYEYMQTESGRELLRLEKIGNWVVTIGVVLALVALVIYWKMN